jgi:hypothetical protein
MKSVSQAMRQPEAGPYFSPARAQADQFLPATIVEKPASGKGFGAFGGVPK